ncbi:MAG TPA: immunoglobulin-like domain-containing protein [Sphingobacterium sp.]|nr:immunoglobulin-like domain-containing protein [Sphingobacterium sp.]
MKNSLLLFVLAAILWSCGQGGNNNDRRSSGHRNGSKADTVRQGVTFSVQPDVFKRSTLPDSVQVKISNNTTDTLITGVSYHIEMLENGKWTVVSPDDMVFISIGVLIPPSSDQFFTKGMLKDQIPYRTGEYRIVKPYVKGNFQKTREEHFLYAPFTIE